MKRTFVVISVHTEQVDFEPGDNFMETSNEGPVTKIRTIIDDLPEALVRLNKAIIEAATR